MEHEPALHVWHAERRFCWFPGDYNNNGVVDAADYVLWRKIITRRSRCPTIRRREPTQRITPFGGPISVSRPVLDPVRAPLLAYRAVLSLNPVVFCCSLHVYSFLPAAATALAKPDAGSLNCKVI